MAKRAASAGTPATLALTAAGIPFAVHPYEHDPAAPSYGLEAAAALGVEPDRVFKTLLADTEAGIVVGVVPVTGMLDLKALASAVGAMQHLGWNNVMWGSDYPHLEGTYGHTQKTLHELFHDTPEPIRHRITIGAFHDLFPETGQPPPDEY